jgi:hypothetical protein
MTHLDWEGRKGFFQRWYLRHEPNNKQQQLATWWDGWWRCCRWENERRRPCTHRLGGFDEDFVLSQLKLVTVHVDGLQQVEDALFLVSSPHRPGGFGQNGIPARTSGERISLRMDGLGCLQGEAAPPGSVGTC